ncbi:hypothetical protein JCM19000A_33870 [Silvimonas sp. JCM 19000]
MRKAGWPGVWGLWSKAVVVTYWQGRSNLSDRPTMQPNTLISRGSRALHRRPGAVPISGCRAKRGNKAGFQVELKGEEAVWQ